MAGLRLGTRIAIINDDDHILLSKRGDFATWALPGGRLDSGELLADAAIREAEEETGLQVTLVRAVGLYFQQGRQRLNVLYRAKPIGGTLHDRTDETLANRYFAPDDLPQPLFGQHYIHHAYSDQMHLHTQHTSPLELLKIDLKLRQRWLQNYLTGRPEPTFADFRVWAVGIVLDDEGQRALTVNGDDRRAAQRAILPRIAIKGDSHLHTALSRRLQRHCDTPLQWHWIGLWQNPGIDTMEFIFVATAMPRAGREHLWRSLAVMDGGRGRDQAYLARISDSSTHPIWTMTADDPYFVL